MKNFRNLNQSELNIATSDDDFIDYIHEMFMQDGEQKLEFVWRKGNRKARINGTMEVVVEGDEIGYLMICPDCGSAVLYLYDYQIVNQELVCNVCGYNE